MLKRICTYIHNIAVSKFENQSCCYFPFEINNLVKGMNPLSLTSYWVNITTTVLLYGRFSIK